MMMSTQQPPQRRPMVASFWVLALMMAWMGSTSAFISPASQSSSFVQKQRFQPAPARVVALPTRRTTTKSQLTMFMGTDGGILGVGTPELFTILLVGYFVLGPSDLYKLTKEIGKFVQNVRTFGAEATSMVENNLESNLQLEEIRKAQRELNEAFSFRRTINVDADTEAFEVDVLSPRGEGPPVPVGTVPVATTTTTTTTATGGSTTGDDEEGEGAAPKPKKRRRRRVVKKKVVEEEEEQQKTFSVGDANVGTVANNVPDLSIDDRLAESEERAMRSLEEANEELRLEAEAEERREARLKRLEQSGTTTQPSSSNYLESLTSSFEDDEENMLARQELASTEGYDVSTTAESRFQAQLNGGWNDQVLAMEDDLTPLAEIMERIAILEEEKNANDARLQEEFRLREENEELFYSQKKELLVEAAAKIQAQAYSNAGPQVNSNSTSTK